MSCVHSVNTPKGIMKKIMKTMRTKTSDVCAAYVKGSAAYQTCVKGELEGMKEHHQPAEVFMEHVMKMGKKHGHMSSSTSSAQ